MVDGVLDTELTAGLRQYASALGFGAIGVTAWDPQHVTDRGRGRQAGDRVVIAVLEQNYESTQAIPRAGLPAAFDSEAESLELTVRLVRFLQARGYRARAHGKMDAQTIPFAIAAGLGQLGLNSQLLTPAAGSRCRLTMLTTDAPLVMGDVVDCGLHGICDRCQVCVHRCPVGAIPKRRKMHRGVEKIKINQKRCFATVAQADGCAVCMKVCPVQRYGLAAVLSEFAHSGRILGRGSDQLEGYDWPLDGRHYGPGERPRLPIAFHDPPGFGFRVH